MIQRGNYGIEYKKKMGRELSLGQSSLSAVSKREGISVQTLRNWRDKYGLDAPIANSDLSNEVKELKALVTKYESALGEMALELHVLKKVQEFALALEKRRNLSGIISPSISGSRRVVK